MNPPIVKSSPTPSTILADNSQLAVVLVEPRIPQNAGNIARLCACTGSELYLVGDLGFRLGAKEYSRAGMDYTDLVDTKHVMDFKDVLAEKPDWQIYYLSTKAKNSHTEVKYSPKTLLVFGSENKGLPEWVMQQYPEQSLRIPMVEDARSLNLANSVSIVLYEALRQIQV